MWFRVTSSNSVLAWGFYLQEVPADVRILQSQFLEVDESKMTGESISVPKDPFALHPENASLFELTNIATAGSLVTKGKGTGIVYQTGLATTLGQILARSHKVKDKKTKLQIGLKEVAWVLSIAALVSSVVGALLGFVKHMRWQDILLSGLSLAFASIPEELPILIAAVLAVGSQTLSRKNVYVKYLRAAENLGFVDTVITDKTGTLTENKLRLHSMHFGECLVPADEVATRVAEGYDAAGFEALLTAWVFMSEIGDGANENKENEIAVVHAMVEGNEPGVLPTEEVVDEIHLDMIPLTGAVELERTDSSSPQTSATVVGGDAFDHAILGGLGVTRLKMANSAPELVAKDSEIEHHFQAVQVAKAEANLSDETPFCPTLKFASRTFSMLKDRRVNSEVPSVHRVTYMKGAPELLLELSTYALEDGRYVLVENMRQQLEEQIWGAASAGLRLIGYAQSVTHRSEDVANKARGDPSSVTAMEGTTFLGFMAFQDAVRPGVAEAVETCHQAGVRVIMVTGDHLKTGLSIASASGILDYEGFEGREDVAGVSCADVLLQCMAEEEIQNLVAETCVFARTTPNDKLIILETLQGSGKCVMATGDGFNDAPILAKADVGVAMGKGTDVAREAASIVFVDDNFAMVPFALAEGRRLLANLRKALAFYLGAKIGLIMLFIIGTLWKSFPLSAIQIIVLELFMDLGASTSFVMEPADTDIMRRPPLDSTKRFFNREIVGGILVSALCMIFTVLVSFAYGVYVHPETAQSSAFLAWLLAHVLLALNLRTFREPVYYKGFFSNPAMCVWLVAAVGLAATSSVSALLRRHLKLEVVPLRQWLVLTVICVCGTFWVEMAKIISARRSAVISDHADKREEQTSLLAAP
uniref:P-type Cu(+) transporter n=1 Tax=Physcomitrium patens TaxID=3218 RepID=A0A7I4DNP2_PHYPA